MKFAKMSGAGNDFVVIDNRDLSWKLSQEQIAHLCHRQFGVGADGFLAVEPGVDGADFRMRYYNADGGEAEMCGNGARCFARFSRDLLSSPKEKITFLTQAGLIHARYEGTDVAIRLTEPTGLSLAQKLPVSTGHASVSSLNTGVPHAVIFVSDIDNVPVDALGRELRHHKAFEPKGTNVNFVQVLGPDFIRVRTYERGVEAETLACGTGVTASAILAHHQHKVTTPVRVQVQSGDQLIIRFDPRPEGASNVELQGPAVIVFRGEIDI